MKILYLTGIVTIPNDEANDKIQKAKEDRKERRRSPNWESLGLPTPKDELEYDEDGLLLLEDEDMKEVYTSVSIVLSQFAGAEDHLDGGSMVYTKGRRLYRVSENADQVCSYAEMLDMSWLKRNLIFFKAKILNFFSKKEEENLHI